MEERGVSSLWVDLRSVTITCFLGKNLHPKCVLLGRFSGKRNTLPVLCWSCEAQEFPQPNSYGQGKQGNLKVNEKETKWKSIMWDAECLSLHSVPWEIRMLHSSCISWFLLQFMCGAFKNRTQLLHASAVSPRPFLGMRFTLKKQSQNTHCSPVPIHSRVDWEQHISFNFKCVWFCFLYHTFLAIYIGFFSFFLC